MAITGYKKLNVYFVGCTGADLQSKHDPLEIEVQIDEPKVDYKEVWLQILKHVSATYQPDTVWCQKSQF